jgi:hypothetical protein
LESHQAHAEYASATELGLLILDTDQQARPIRHRGGSAPLGQGLLPSHVAVLRLTKHARHIRAKNTHGLDANAGAVSIYHSAITANWELVSDGQSVGH